MTSPVSLGLDVTVLLATFAVILPAELPDKSFIATLVLATRYPRLPVWLGASAAFLVQMLIAVAAGRLLAFLPRTLVLGATAVLFFVGAALLIRGGMQAREEATREEDEEAEEIASHVRVGQRGFAAFATTFVIIFTAEWGDLTQLIAAGQAARTDSPVAVFIGASAALVLVAGLGVLVGGWLHQRVPLWRVRVVSGVILLVLGAVTIVELVNGA